MKNTMRTGLLIAALVGALIAPTVAQAASAKETKQSGSVYFGISSAHLDKADKKKLNSWLAELKNAKSVTVTGYVQDSASDSNNKSLSRKRAKAVARYLKAHGVTATIRIVAKGLPAKHRHSKIARRATVTFTPASSTNGGATPTPSPSASPILSFESYSITTSNTCDPYSGNSHAKTATITYGSTTRTANFVLADTVSQSTYIEFDTVSLYCKYVATFSNVPAGTYSYTLTATSDAPYWVDVILNSQAEYTFTPSGGSTITASQTPNTWDGATIFSSVTSPCQYSSIPNSQTDAILGDWTDLTMGTSDTVGPKTTIFGGCD